MYTFILVLLIWNAIVLSVYGVDKWLAKMQRRRISETTLLLCTFLLGGYGATLGMILFNHKTSKMKFRLLVPLAMLVALSVCVLLVLS